MRKKAAIIYFKVEIYVIGFRILLTCISLDIPVSPASAAPYQTGSSPVAEACEAVESRLESRSQGTAAHNTGQEQGPSYFFVNVIIQLFQLIVQRLNISHFGKSKT